ncbi:hypothetical protein B1A_13968, partial [mine drainage metagenome]
LGLSQTDLSNLYRTMAVAVMKGGEIGKKARQLHEVMKAAGHDVAGFFGTSSPADFGNAMLSLNDDEYSRRETAMEGVKVIFNPDSLSNLATRAAKNMQDTALWGRIYEDFIKTGADKKDGADSV